jgi:hypothetical protein
MAAKDVVGKIWKHSGSDQDWIMEFIFTFYGVPDFSTAEIKTKEIIKKAFPEHEMIIESIME